MLGAGEVLNERDLASPRRDVPANQSNACCNLATVEFSAKQRISSLPPFKPYGRPRKLVKTLRLAACFTKEAELKSWWDLIFGEKKKSAPSPLPALCPTATSKPVTKAENCKSSNFMK